jgi:2-polyprenyl-3-methyl-5-hydroxy-6-metoxy-1,4-benzoquinol methylase
VILPPVGDESTAPAATERARRDIEFHRLTATSYDESVTREHAIYHQHSLVPWLATVGETGAAVDLGCGTGVVSMALAERGFRVTGIDHSPEMLEIARRKAAEHGLGDRVELRAGDVLDPGIEPGSADVVTCQGLLHHLEDLEPCVEVIARTLRPGGSFYISEPTADPAPPGRVVAAAIGLAKRLRRALRRGDRPVPPQSGEEPVRWPDLAAALDRNGLEYEAKFITHIPLIHTFVPDRVRLWLELAVSHPWRRRRGDLVFVTGTKPPRR